MNNDFKGIRKLRGNAASKVGHWSVELTANDGEVSFTNQRNYDISFALVRLIMTAEAHMIIIKKDGKDFQRWDRERFVDSNGWNETCNLNTAKESGHIIQYRQITHSTSSTIH